MRKDRRFILFDFDGVIADSFALAFDVGRAIHPHLTEKSYRALFEGNVYESLKAIGQDGRSDEYFALFGPRAKEETHLIPGMDRVVATLAADYPLVIISSTVTTHIREFLTSHGLVSYFIEIMGQDVHTSKVEKMRMVFEKYATTAGNCVFVTDTLGDMREAKEHDLGVIAVPWGFHPRETLEKGIPFRIVARPAELLDAVDDYFARDSV